MNAMLHAMHMMLYVMHGVQQVYLKQGAGIQLDPVQSGTATGSKIESLRLLNPPLSVPGDTRAFR